MDPFKSCPMCKKEWATQDEFLFDAEVNLGGYQSDFVNPDGGLFLFTHTHSGCGTSLAHKVSFFSNLYTGIKHSHSKFGTEVCEGKCLNTSNLERCKQECSFSHIREILDMLVKLSHLKNGDKLTQVTIPGKKQKHGTGL